jgi:GTP1/Obg family GTP-binding protein
MKQMEKDLLNKGFNKQTLQRTIDVKQELLKLKSCRLKAKIIVGSPKLGKSSFLIKRKPCLMPYGIFK